METEVTFWATVSPMLPDLPDPSAASASMVTVPFFFAVTRPFWSTVAMLSFLDFQVTLGMLAFPGSVSACSCRVSPAFTVFPSGEETVTRVTG